MTQDNSSYIPEGNPSAVDVPSTNGEAIISEVAAERRRQIEREGWTHDHDDAHQANELASAAAMYALSFNGAIGPGKPIWVRFWPWDWEWWKPKTRRQDLIRAAALIIAEIERLDRASPKSEGTEPAQSKQPAAL